MNDNSHILPIVTAIALGSNLGDRMAYLKGARDKISDFMTITAISPVYESPAAYVTDQPSFLNAVLLGTTTLSAHELLLHVKNLEVILGRQPTFRYGPRTIDLDILFYGSHIINTPNLTLPHPLIAERSFVLFPLADVLPDWRHPLTGANIASMIKEIANEPITKLAERL